MKTVILSHTIEHNAANAQVGPDGQAVTSLWKAKKAFVLDRPERQILNQMVLSKIISVTTNQPVSATFSPSLHSASLKYELLS